MTRNITRYNVTNKVIIKVPYGADININIKVCDDIKCDENGLVWAYDEEQMWTDTYCLEDASDIVLDSDDISTDSFSYDDEIDAISSCEYGEDNGSVCSLSDWNNKDNECSSLAEWCDDESDFSVTNDESVAFPIFDIADSDETVSDLTESGSETLTENIDADVNTTGNSKTDSVVDYDIYRRKYRVKTRNSTIKKNWVKFSNMSPALRSSATKFRKGYIGQKARYPIRSLKERIATAYKL